MKVASIKEFGGPEVFVIEDRPDPTPIGDQVLIQIKAAGINRPDVFQRKGNYPAPVGISNDVPGLEVSGIVKGIGPFVSNFRLGDEVMALLPGEGYASLVCISERVCLPKPKNISFEEAACFPETVYTVWNNLFERGKLRKSERVLIHGGTGGIGSTAIQLAKLFGAIVYTTVGSDEKKKIAFDLGADFVINYKKEDFFEAFKNEGIAVVLDSIGGAYFNKHIGLLKEDGRLIQINATHGARVEINLLKLMQKRIIVTGSTLRIRDIAFKADLTKEIETNILPLVKDRRFIPLLTKVFTLEDVIKAHQYFESESQYGKIALRIDG